MCENTVIDTKKVKDKSGKNIITEITECQEEYEALDDETVFATGNMEMNTNETMES